MITKEELQQLGVSYREFTKGLCYYLDMQWSDAFYQHMMRVLNGEVKPTLEEENASAMWLQVHQEPHVVGAKYEALVRNKRTVEILRRYMRSGVYNNTQIERMFSRILSLMG
jgi:hypothetical protein